MDTFEKQFKNELGNNIQVKVTSKEIDGTPGVMIYISGPTSLSENQITKMEAEVILNGLESLFDKDGLNQKDTYFVAVKVFLKKGSKLLIMKDNFGDWDLPGGRIKPDEFETPLEDIIRRKMSEELGNDIKYTIGKPVVFMRHERIEASTNSPVRIFAIGYEGTLESGEVKTSERHPEFLWVEPDTFKPESYFKGGWLKGIQEYLNLTK
ncbi:MAG: hypothetical protein UX31_C0001G0025 [Candidatus Nomurabacteria bacterium GW2011_GWA1_46_11]|uniref:Nudix hydrolase domain-containing protein n=2 Tax=Parcubacteria group TaxID=1794811 RepID=A0A1F8EYW1_9BACT|nr:MAG: hypothetical protein UX31_C0001G0025 [Candidatus Nomurabacteria bacterium GW2011_GWA1_46_11]OGN06057.1 MAG: hypothetical protein A2669_00810 [Candidatus Yanofskybacteria bacterium RIFCSPHIGHO2_01_FULL_48_25b]